MRFLCSVPGLVCFLALAMSTRSWAQDLVISEFMATNDNVIRDQDGDFVDWIEVYNAGSTRADLDGWCLTDNPNDLRKWCFPDVSIEPGGFLLVFASDKDRRDPGLQLHTNFKLASSGGYLALVEPGGGVAWDFGESYPPQVENISYGLSQNASVAELVKSGDSARTLIPGNGNLGLNWTQATFSDAGWISGATGVGYDRSSTYRSLIRTDLGGNMDGTNTTAYIRVPFNVSDPAMFGGMILRMKYDDGFVAYVNGEEIASRNAPPSPRWDSSATALHDDGAAVVFEEYGIPDTGGLLRAGQNVLAVHGLNDNLGSSDFLIVPELDAFDSGTLERDVRQFFLQPSPGYGNLPGFDAIAPKPEFSHPSMVFTTGLSVNLMASSPEAVIRYTVDGSTPTQSSTLFGGPISVQDTTMVQARSFQDNAGPSPVVTRTYVKIATNVRDFTSDLPIMVIDTFGQGINDQWRGPVFFAVMEPSPETGRTAITGTPTASGRGGIKLRGSSSAGFPKKMYAFEVWDDRNRDLDMALLDLPPESDWVLYAPYSDKSLMRNHLSYSWSNLIGRYAPRTKFLELYVNTGGGNLDASDYVGVYVLIEKIKRGDDRVDIRNLRASHSSEPEITGGYILKKDRLDPGDSGFTTSRGQRLAYVDPKEANITPAQAAWIRDYLNQFEAALYGSNFRDPENGYARYIDVDSFVDHHIMVELTKNIDGFRLSTFMYKDRGGKLHMGPIWDYNLSLGNANYLNGWIATGWYWSQLSSNDYPWYRRLFEDAEFAQRYADRWGAFRSTVLTVSKLLADVDQTALSLNEAQARNFSRWRILGQYVWPNWYIANTWREELIWMKGWITDRVQWYDNNYLPLPTFNRHGGPINPGFELRISAPSGTILYTLDGTDPRLRGGAVSDSALEYGEPFRLTENTRVKARARVGLGLWSAMVDATFVVTTPPLVITEIMYHPTSPPPGSPFDAEDFEFLEFLNVGREPLDLTGASLTDGIEFTFPPGNLDPGEYVVIVKNLEAFSTRYDTEGMRIAGVYTANLSNAGETVELRGPLNEPILQFDYSDTWYPTTDGQGSSLVIVDPWGRLPDWREKESWMESSVVGGSPGDDDPALSTLGGRQRPGDSNQDGVLDISDVISLLRRLYLDSIPLPCEGASLEEGANLALLDLNSDTAVDISDVVYLLNFLFRHGPAPTQGVTCIRIEGCPQVCGY